MNHIAITNVEKSKRILDSIEARDTSAMGYEAKLRHNERTEEARGAYERAVAEESPVALAQPINTGSA